MFCILFGSILCTIHLFMDYLGMLQSMAVILLVGSSVAGVAAGNGIALTPPMGWSSWNAFHGGINEQVIANVTDQVCAGRCVCARACVHLQYLLKNDCFFPVHISFVAVGGNGPPGSWVRLCKSRRLLDGAFPQQRDWPASPRKELSKRDEGAR